MKIIERGLLQGWWVLVCATLVGCATSPVPLSQAKPAPFDRVYYSANTSPSANARVIFIRDSGVTGMGVHHHLFINNQKAASLAPGEMVELNLVPGEYVFGVKPTDAFGTHSLNSIDQDLKANRKYFYRIQTDGNSMRTVLQRFLPAEQ